MPEKPPRQHPKPSAFTATDLARAAAKMGAAQDLAKQLAAINAPIDALKNAIPVLPATYQIIQPHQTAADLVKALSGYSALSDLAKNFATSLPKVNLNLPDMSRRYRRPYLSQFRTYPCGTKAGRLPADQQRRRGVRAATAHWRGHVRVGRAGAGLHRPPGADAAGRAGRDAADDATAEWPAPQLPARRFPGRG